MSTVCVQLGQCGNQLGYSFFNSLYQETTRNGPGFGNAVFNSFFEDNGGKPQARAVLIDMEPKVVNACLNKEKNWKFNERSVFCQQEGSGNNWAFGYNVHGSKYRDVILDKVRKEGEKCDILRSMMLLLSLAGGTGSGVGASVAESISEELQVPLLGAVVWPYSFGEVILQNYNTALTLAHLIEATDGLIIFQNDWLHYTAVNCLSVNSPDFTHMNGVGASALSSIFAPVFPSGVSSSSSQYAQNPLQKVLSNLCSLPGYPFLNVVTEPIESASSREFSNDSWATLVKRCAQMQVSNTQAPNINWSVHSDSPSRNKTLSSVAVLRGRECASADTSQLKFQENFHCFKYAEFRSELEFAKYERKCTLISNSQAILHPLDTLVDKTFEMSKTGAYLHHYNKFGIENNHLLEFAFPSLEQVIFNYKNI